jgi:hypothetical protein
MEDKGALSVQTTFLWTHQAGNTRNPAQSAPKSPEVAGMDTTGPAALNMHRITRQPALKNSKHD